MPKVAIFAIPRFFFIEKNDKWSITQQPRRVRPSYRAQMKALFTGFHLLYCLAQCSKYSMRYERQSSALGGQGPGPVWDRFSEFVLGPQPNNDFWTGIGNLA